jgi:uncharacterized protein (TIGR02284 family)
MMANSKTVSVLNDLIEVSKDGEQGFRKAAEDTKTFQLKSTFQECADDISRGINELQSAVTTMGGQPETSGSMTGALHRGWIDLKSAVVDRTDLAILEECERGEDVAKQRFTDALNEDDLDLQARSLIERQYQGVLRNHERVRDLRNRYRAQ